MKSLFQGVLHSGIGIIDYLPRIVSKFGILGSIIVIFLGAQPAFSQSLNNFKPGSEPEGLGSIVWGTDLKTFENMAYYRQDPSYGGIDVYRKKNNECEIFGVSVKNIDFLFWKGKFCGISFFEEDFSRFEQFKDVVSKKFGFGKKALPNQEYHVWEGKKTLMSLEYKLREKSILFLMLSVSVLRQMEGKDKEQ